MCRTFGECWIWMVGSITPKAGNPHIGILGAFYFPKIIMAINTLNGVNVTIEDRIH